MKVKVLSGNLMGADYKPLSVGAEIEIKEGTVLNAWLKASLVELTDSKHQSEPLIVSLDGVDVDLNSLTAKELYELSTKYELGVTQESKEVKANFAKRIFDAVTAKDKE